MRESSTARTGSGSVPHSTQREKIDRPNVPVGDERYGERPTTYERADLRSGEELEETRRETETR